MKILDFFCLVMFAKYQFSGYKQIKTLSARFKVNREIITKLCKVHYHHEILGENWVNKKHYLEGVRQRLVRLGQKPNRVFPPSLMPSQLTKVLRHLKMSWMRVVQQINSSLSL